MRSRKAALVTVLALLAGCTSARPPRAMAKRADEQAVAGCRFQGAVQGSSVLGGVSSHKGTENAKPKALGPLA